MPEIIGWFSGILTAFYLFKALFKTREEFYECLRFWFTPDIISAFKGEFFEDRWSEFKIIIWLGISIFVGYGAYKLFS